MLDMSTIKKHGPTGIWYRPETDDGSVLGERKDYTKLIEVMTKDDVVLDAGGHIGITTCLFAPLVREVVTVEPDVDNLTLMKHNLAEKQITNVLIYPGVLAAEDGEYQLWLNQKKGQCAHSLSPRRGRVAVPVTGFSFTNMLNQHRPTLIKMDIEGGEYPLMNTLMNLPDYVKGIAIEMHFNSKGWQSDLAPALHAGILSSGFRCVAEPEMLTNWRGTTPVYLRP